MDNDFIKGMEILINCKKIVEDLVEENKFLLSQMDEKGAEFTYSSHETIQRKINLYQGVLDGRNLVLKTKG